MKIYITILMCITIQCVFGQVENSKAIIAKNHVKSSFEKHCFPGSNGGCTSFFRAYDQRGNIKEWNMGRLGTLYRSTYDNNDNKITLQWIDKIDTTDVTLFRYSYDRRNNLIKDESGTYKNEYDNEGRLIQITSETANEDNTIERKTILNVWSGFNKILTETTKIETIDSDNSKTLEHLFLKTYDYDENQNLIKERHVSDYEIKNTITYNYDDLNRLIEKVEIDSLRIARLNRMVYGDRAPLEALTTRLTYNTNGSIKETYQYFSDPCMGLDNHFLYKHMYHDNGLLSQVDVYENETLRFSISYDYEYYNN